MPLTNTEIKNAKPAAKPYKLFDGGGLFLVIQPGGGKLWRYKYRYAGKEKLLAIGAYPDLSLAEARDVHSRARNTLAAGNDPSETKKETRRLRILQSENTLEAIAKEWHGQRKHEWVASHAESVLTRLERHVFKKIGQRPITDITPPELLSVFRVVEKSGALDMAQRVMQYTGQIFTYAIATGRLERNPVNDLRGALKAAKQLYERYIEAKKRSVTVKTALSQSQEMQKKMYHIAARSFGYS